MLSDITLNKSFFGHFSKRTSAPLNIFLFGVRDCFGTKITTKKHMSMMPQQQFFGAQNYANSNPCLC